MIKFCIFIFLSVGFLSCGSSPVVKSQTQEKKGKEIKIGETTGVLSQKTVTNKILKENDSASAAYHRLEQAITSGNSEKIKEISTELLQINMKDFKAMNSLAMYYYGKRQFEAAELLLHKALTVNPKSSEVYNNLGLVELAKNNKREALNMYRKSMQLDPKNYLAALNAAAVYAKEKDYNKVIFSLDKFIKNEKYDADSFNNYAIALSAAGKNIEAVAIYDRILKDNPDHKYALLNYAIL